MTASNLQLESSTLPPAQPSYILRGHTAQIHVLHFFHQNLNLLSGDAEGWIVLWDLPIKRPTAVWRAHDATVLGLGTWGDDVVITHGRDNKLLVWQLQPEHEKQYSTTLPIEDATTERKKPWLLHSIPVNALNFCAFASMRMTSLSSSAKGDIIIATPGLQDGAINLISLPSEVRIATIPPPKDTKTGMLMAVALHSIDSPNERDRLVVLAGYESGHVARWSRLPSNPTAWQTTYNFQPHTQPVLSIGLDPGSGFWYSSSADAILGKHPLSPAVGDEPAIHKTKHAGQQSLCVRDDGRIFATAGWDGRVRVYSARSTKELAVLKWHKEGVYAVAFAATDYTQQQQRQQQPVMDGEIGVAIMAKRTLTVAEQRVARTQSTHWLAAGSKDGKVSLWDIY